MIIARNFSKTNMKSDRAIAIDTLKSELKRFRDRRDWLKFHDPKNLAEAITIEASELLELFLWKNPTEIQTLAKTNKAFRKEIENELADVFCFALNLANVLNLDVSTIVQRKISQNEKRYPVRKSRGTATKYTSL
jgi:NTP pyrophosphatase (non-canonical NTP hydrolase)